MLSAALPMTSMDSVTELPSEESQWVAAATNGDPQAFEKLYRAHRRNVFGLCLRMCRDNFEAEECAQEAFVQAWRKLKLFRGESGFGTWMHRVTVNTVLGRMRKAKREADRLRFLPEPHDDHPTPDPEIGTRDVEQALQTLPGGARSVVVLCGIYGYSHEEASSMLGIAVGTCKAQLHRGRKILAAQLAVTA